MLAKNETAASVFFFGDTPQSFQWNVHSLDLAVWGPVSGTSTVWQQPRAQADMPCRPLCFPARHCCSFSPHWHTGFGGRGALPAVLGGTLFPPTLTLLPSWEWRSMRLPMYWWGRAYVADTLPAPPSLTGR